MIDPVRQEVIALAHTVVVKVGTNVLTRPDGALEPARVQALADQLHRLRSTGRKVALVSSGAVEVVPQLLDALLEQRIDVGARRFYIGRPDDAQHLIVHVEGLRERQLGDGFLVDVVLTAADQK